VWGFIVAGHHARLAPLFIHLGLLLAGIALLIRLLLLLLVLLLARLLLTTAALLLIALIGHQVAPRFRPSLPDPINGRLGTTASPHIQDCCWRVASFPRTRRVNQIVESVLKIKNPKPPAATRAVDGKF
jgi:hypothetical protein